MGGPGLVGLLLGLNNPPGPPWVKPVCMTCRLSVSLYGIWQNLCSGICVELLHSSDSHLPTRFLSGTLRLSIYSFISVSVSFTISPPFPSPSRDRILSDNLFLSLSLSASKHLTPGNPLNSAMGLFSCWSLIDLISGLRGKNDL